LPPDAQEFLKALPSQKIDLGIVAGQALKNASQFKKIYARALSAEAAELQSGAALDWQLGAKANFVFDKNEAGSNNQPSNYEVSTYNINLSKNFNTGTAVKFEAEAGKNNFDVFGNNVNYYQSHIGLSLQQSLLRNFLGKNIQRLSKIGKLQKEAINFSIEDAIHQNLYGVIEIFYNAWMGQKAFRAEEANQRRKSSLYKVTKIKSDRGTAEGPDLIQSREAYRLSKITSATAREQLQEVWGALVISLGFPSHWASIEAANLPISLKYRSDQKALKLCQNKIKADSFNDNPLIKSIDRQVKSQELEVENIKNEAKPDLNIQLGLKANGTDPQKRYSTFDESFRFENPNWQVGVNFNMNLGNTASKATALSLLSKSKEAEFQKSAAVDQMRIQWQNTCQKLKRLQSEVKILKTSLSEQKRRAQLEERRFKNGRSSLLQLIQAGDDITRTELMSYKQQRDLHLAAWKIEMLSDHFKSFIAQVKNIKVKLP